MYSIILAVIISYIKMFLLHMTLPFFLRLEYFSVLFNICQWRWTMFFHDFIKKMLQPTCEESFEKTYEKKGNC